MNEDLQQKFDEYLHATSYGVLRRARVAGLVVNRERLTRVILDFDGMALLCCDDIFMSLPHTIGEYLGRSEPVSRFTVDFRLSCGSLLPATTGPLRLFRTQMVTNCVVRVVVDGLLIAALRLTDGVPRIFKPPPSRYVLQIPCTWLELQEFLDAEPNAKRS